MIILLHHYSGQMERIAASNIEVDPSYDMVLTFVKDGNMERVSLFDVYKMEVLFE